MALDFGSKKAPSFIKENINEIAALRDQKATWKEVAALVSTRSGHAISEHFLRTYFYKYKHLVIEDIKKAAVLVIAQQSNRSSLLDGFMQNRPAPAPARREPVKPAQKSQPEPLKISVEIKRDDQKPTVDEVVNGFAVPPFSSLIDECQRLVRENKKGAFVYVADSLGKKRRFSLNYMYQEAVASGGIRSWEELNKKTGLLNNN